MSMVNVVTIAAYRRIYWLRLIGLVQRLAATWRCVLHSSDEPGELSQWQCTATIMRAFLNSFVSFCFRISYSQQFRHSLQARSIPHRNPDYRMSL